jgi:ribosomal protein S18 acetylase RimI-like enzyme
MIFREAQIADITQMHVVRIAVKENILPNPDLITAKDYEEFVTQRGKGWVCEIDGFVVGFCIAALKDNNVWALFVHPEFDGKGIGRRLHDEMLEWYFSQTNKTIWLGTSPNTRAEKFYRKAGWKETAIRPNGEIKFEMSEDDWIKILEER